jgi:hypothetical protein
MFRGWFQKSKWRPCLRSVLPTNSILLCVFLWTKGLNTKDTHKEMFPVYGGKCLSRKAVRNWVANVSSMTRLKRRCRVAETTVKRFLFCGFRRTGKAMGQVFQCWWMICREINVFSRFKYHMFHSHLWPIYWVSLVIYFLCPQLRSSQNPLLPSSGYKCNLCREKWYGYMEEKMGSELWVNQKQTKKVTQGMYRGKCKGGKRRQKHKKERLSNRGKKR